MTTSRRQFLRTAAGGAGIFLIGPHLAFAQAATQRRFVFVIQRGAADGLNTVIPYADPAYARLRGELAIAPADGLRLDGSFALHPALAPLRGLLLALLEGNAPRELPERLLTLAMARHGLQRVDFLGAAPGMWTLHPPYRCADFYQKLPELVRQVEAGEMPAAQLGFHDVGDSLVDWSEARARLAHRRWWHRLAARFRA